MKFVNSIIPRYYETDQMGVIYHSNYLVWFETARNNLFKELGYDYSAVEKAGIIMPVRNVSCSYISPARYGMDISVECEVLEFTGVRLLLGYEVFDASLGTLLAKGTTEHGITDNSLKVVNLKKKNKKLYDLIKECCYE